MGDALGNSKRIRTSVEWRQDNNLELASVASRHQVGGAVFCDGKGTGARLRAQRITIFSKDQDIK